MPFITLTITSLESSTLRAFATSKIIKHLPPIFICSHAAHDGWGLTSLIGHRDVNIKWVSLPQHLKTHRHQHPEFSCAPLHPFNVGAHTLAPETVRIPLMPLPLLTHPSTTACSPFSHTADAVMVGMLPITHSYYIIQNLSTC